MQIRQGDVLLIRRDPPAEARLVEDARGLRVPGERTGHTHTLEADVFETPVGRMLRLAEPGVLSHPEHGNVPVPPGWWEPHPQREFTETVPVPRARFD